jgi:hypothetical protein
MRTAGSIFGVLLAASLGACAQHNAQNAGAQGPYQAQAPMQGQGQAQMPAPAATTCPMAQLPGVRATVAEISDGVAITFTGPQSALDQLRPNVQAMADANDKQGDPFAACSCPQTLGGGSAEPMPGDQNSPSGMPGPGSYGGTGRPMNHGSAMSQIPPSAAKVDQIPTGAVLELKSKDRTQIQALRTAVMQNVHALKQGCLGQSGPSNVGEQNR